MKDILINQDVSIYLIDNVAIINGFLYCLGIIMAIIVYTYGIKFFINCNKKHKISNGGYISLLLFENRICIKNAKIKCKSVENHHDMEKIYDDIFICFKNYGFYVLSQSSLNRKDSDFYFSNVWGPIFITFVTNFVCELFGLGISKFLYLALAIAITFIVMRFSIEADALNVHKDFFNADGLINTFYNKYPNLIKVTDFDINYLSEADKIFLKNKSGKYLKIINKIQKTEKQKHPSRLNIDIFNFSQEQLNEYYNLSAKEIEIYNEFKKMRYKHIEKNKYE